MPITISSIDFEDMFSVNRTFYQANAGDKQTFTCTITENIAIAETPSVLMTYFAGINQVNLSGANFLTEGFEPGDEIEIIIYNSNGSVHHTNTVDIVSVTATSMIVNASLTWKRTYSFIHFSYFYTDLTCFLLSFIFFGAQILLSSSLPQIAITPKSCTSLYIHMLP